jgi:hypothetical protein
MEAQMSAAKLAIPEAPPTIQHVLERFNEEIGEYHNRLFILNGLTSMATGSGAELEKSVSAEPSYHGEALWKSVRELNYLNTTLGQIIEKLQGFI